MVNTESLRISEIAERSNVSVDTVRYYERKGLLRDVVRDAAGHRRFPPSVAGRILVIRRATALGFTLDELARIFQRRGSGQAPCGHVLQSAKQKLVALDERIAELQSLRATLAETIVAWEHRYREVPNGTLAHLLESLVGKEES